MLRLPAAAALENRGAMRLLLCLAATSALRPAPVVRVPAAPPAAPAAVAAAAPAHVDRRSSLSLFSACALGTAARPGFAAEPEQPNPSVLLVLRVQEACAQETRLIKSGKFKDLQRANIKLAVNLMLTNYQLLDNVNQASVLARGRSQEALSVGVTAVDALQQVLEYFDSSSKSLKVDTLSGEKQDFVVKALDVTSQRLDQFLGYLPSEQVTKAKALIAYENDLNLKEYAESNKGEKYLNPVPGV